MPIFTESQTLDNHHIGHFGYSAVPLDELQGAAQYTLATIVCDRSGSTISFTDVMTDALKASIKALQQHPLRDQILVRVVAFDDIMEEIHGFIPVTSIDFDQYDGCLSPRGMTALFDGCISAAEATEDYSKSLAMQKYMNNAIIIVITDGLNNMGKFANPYDVDHVHSAFRAAMERESLESIVTLLIAVNTERADILKVLKAFHKDAGFTNPMIDVKQATPETIARVGRFITSSISSTSQVLGTGGPSQSLQF